MTTTDEVLEIFVVSEPWKADQDDASRASVVREHVALVRFLFSYLTDAEAAIQRRLIESGAAANFAVEDPFETPLQSLDRHERAERRDRRLDRETRGRDGTSRTLLHGEFGNLGLFYKACRARTAA